MVTTSLVPDGATRANGGTLSVAQPPSSVIVNFSRAVDEASVVATDLVLSGSALNPLSPVRVSSVTWLDDHTAQFNLTGPLNSSGSVNVSVPSGSIKSSTGTSISGYSDQVVLTTQPVVTVPVTPTPGSGPGPVTTTPSPTKPPKKVPVKVKHPHPKPVVHKVTHKHTVTKPAPHKALVHVPKHKLPTVKVVTRKKP